MKLGNYTLKIVGGTEMAGGYVALVHGQRYRVSLQNHGARKCDAKLVIDGTEMGLFRVDPGKLIEIEHPSHSSGCFTFFELATPEAHAAGLKSMSQTGLITAIFMPEIQHAVTLASAPAIARTTPMLKPDADGMRLNSAPFIRQAPPSPPTPPKQETNGMALYSAPAQRPPQEEDGATGLTPGGSGLSGHSKQSFHSVAHIQCAPSHEFVTITLRLGGAVVQNIRPLVPEPLANPVPPPLT